MHTEVQNDFLASEMLSELKATSKRKDFIIIAELVLILAVIGGFLFYLLQYDFCSTVTETTNKTANGVYALVDSEGNVVSSDLSEDMIKAILESGTVGDVTSSQCEKENSNP